MLAQDAVLYCCKFLIYIKFWSSAYIWSTASYTYILHHISKEIPSIDNC